jgi:hypothetical protein
MKLLLLFFCKVVVSVFLERLVYIRCQIVVWFVLLLMEFLIHQKKKKNEIYRRNQN